MATILKCILAVFIVAGIMISFYGGWEILSTYHFVKNSPERTKGVFKGYHEEEVVSRSSSTNQFGEVYFQDTTSYMSYPEFEFIGKDGQKKRVIESKHHIIARFKPGQEVEIIVPSSPYGEPRLAGFYSLYFLDLCILVFGLCFVFIPLLIGSIGIPLLDTPAGKEMSKFATEQYNSIMSEKVGPITVKALLKGIGIFTVVVLIVVLAQALFPFVKQMRLGFGYDLIEALEHNRFDEARDLIMRQKGINTVTEHDQSPLHLALEKNRPDLARLLINAGADVNIKNKMILSTPLEIAVHSGDLEMVNLLLSKGALPDGGNDEYPPVFRAIIKGHDEIARVLIESGCDLKRHYMSGEERYTVGDLAVIGRRQVLIDLIRQRGGVFTISP
ncbi:MAG: ankyrin repeat domain-containing protein [Desulfobacterota bacterium]|nr:ankyrin repeat domain-containing protein [Thermodesulfobacteriota bacterium]